MPQLTRLLATACLLLGAHQSLRAQSYNLGMFKANDVDAYYLATGKDYYYPFAVTDMGPQFSQTVSYAYSVNGGAAVQQSATVDHNNPDNCINAVNLTRYRIAFTTPLHFNTPGTYQLKVWISTINGQPDSNPLNDTLKRTIRVLSSVPARKGLTEYAYHVSCGPCGDAGDPYFKHLLSHYDDYTVAVKLHNEGGTYAPWNYLDCPEATEIDEAIGDIAHPDFTFNRASLNPYINDDHYYPDYDFCPMDSNFIARDINFHVKVPVELTLSGVAMDFSSRAVSFTMNAEFADALSFSKDARLSCMLVEDSIFYYQANNGTSPIDSIWHRYVLRKVYGGPWGQASSVPASVAAGQVASLTFNDVLPAAYNMNRLYLVPTLQYYGASTSERDVLNVRRYRFSEQASSALPADRSSAGGLFLYPNPAGSSATLDWKEHALSGYAVYSAEGNMRAGAAADGQSSRLSIATDGLAPGLYFVRVYDRQGRSALARLTISR